jgi:hypothetical protein
MLAERSTAVKGETYRREGAETYRRGAYRRVGVERIGLSIGWVGDTRFVGDVKRSRTSTSTITRTMKRGRGMLGITPTRRHADPPSRFSPRPHAPTPSSRYASAHADTPLRRPADTPHADPFLTPCQLTKGLDRGFHAWGPRVTATETQTITVIFSVG